MAAPCRGRGRGSLRGAAAGGPRPLTLRCRVTVRADGRGVMFGVILGAWCEGQSGGRYG